MAGCNIRTKRNHCLSTKVEVIEQSKGEHLLNLPFFHVFWKGQNHIILLSKAVKNVTFFANFAKETV